MISDFQGPVLGLRFSIFRYRRLTQYGLLGGMMAQWRIGMKVGW
jgi:hypothetical protein